MHRLLIFTAILAVTACGSQAKLDDAVVAPAQSGGSATPVVVELFTSQGCSSCPPADQLAAQLDTQSGLVVISRPVTYWDRLGWKDTLGDPANTDLQRAYARRGLGGDNGVFTPQMVIDGRNGVVGSDRGKIGRLVADARTHAHPQLTVRADGRVVVSGQSSTKATLSLVAVDKSETVAIGRGENGNRRITYTNVWLGERDLGGWDGGTETFAIPKVRPAAGKADRYALVLRKETTGPILASRWL